MCPHFKTASEHCEDCVDLIIEMRDAESGVSWNEDRN